MKMHGEIIEIKKISSLRNFLRPAIFLPVSPVKLFFSVRSRKIIPVNYLTELKL